MKRRIVLSIALAFLATIAACVADDAGVVADDQPDEASGIGTSPREEPGPTDTSGVIASVQRRVLLLQFEGPTAQWTTTFNAATGKYETKVITDTPPLSEMQSLGQLYYDLDPASQSTSIVPPICLPGSGGVCPDWPSAPSTGTGRCVCRIGPPMTGCCPFGPTHRP